MWRLWILRSRYSHRRIEVVLCTGLQFEMILGLSLDLVVHLSESFCKFWHTWLILYWSLLLITELPQVNLFLIQPYDSWLYLGEEFVDSSFALLDSRYLDDPCLHGHGEFKWISLHRDLLMIKLFGLLLPQVFKLCKVKDCTFSLF